LSHDEKLIGNLGLAETLQVRAQLHTPPEENAKL
jgi:hypothetical protein